MTTAAPRPTQALAGRHLVFLNWRDSVHPQAGGAELFCHSIAERFAAAGVRVTLLTSRPPGAAAHSMVDGVAVRRGGGTFGVYPSVLARLARMVRSADGVDAVVDCQNGIPFFSPLVLPARIPVVQVLHHVHQKQFPLYFPGPVARVGQLLEAPGSRWVYRRRPVAVVSPSTRDEARGVLALPGARFLVPNGVTVPGGVTGPDGVTSPVDVTGPDRVTGPEHADDLAGRAAGPTIVCVGRLVPHKRLHLLIEAVPALLRAHPDLSVHIVGDGPDRARLADLAARLMITQGDGASDATLRWHGFAPAEVRDAVLASAWLTVNPSHGEGWGLSVLEANGLGVPAVAFRVPGLRDSVRDGVTGWLVDDPAQLGDTISAALTRLADPAQARTVRAAARAWADGFSWDTSADLLAGIIASELDRLGGARSAAPAGPGEPPTRTRGRRLSGAPRPAHRAPGIGHRPARDRRRPDDQLTLVEFDLAASSDLPVLRRTDLLFELTPRTEPGGDTATDPATEDDGRTRRFAALFYGADNTGARTALARRGLRPASRPRPATGEDLLVAAAHPFTRD
ncbi:glycosyl transferase family 1 [Frankia sp. R43]|uniref:glycosyltransferase family 4 protein n=1 Tax=Frankia sp. R43 TaxID=269536 RepID=UPI0006CA3365|nr:glycosyltransferase family 4 protein [Frankia sp. R43]KPM55198.1 glycosyl transferase family 1 [Frankia sp. R43]